MFYYGAAQVCLWVALAVVLKLFFTNVPTLRYLFSKVPR